MAWEGCLSCSTSLLPSRSASWRGRDIGAAAAPVGAGPRRGRGSPRPSAHQHVLVGCLCCCLLLEVDEGTALAWEHPDGLDLPKPAWWSLRSLPHGQPAPTLPTGKAKHSRDGAGMCQRRAHSHGAGARGAGAQVSRSHRTGGQGAGGAPWGQGPGPRMVTRSRAGAGRNTHRLKQSRSTFSVILEVMFPTHSG